MRDLIERVASIIRGGLRDDGTSRDKATASIRAILSHFSEPGNVSDGMRKALVDCPNVMGWKPSIAAMFQAALSELQAKEAGE